MPDTQKPANSKIVARPQPWIVRLTLGGICGWVLSVPALAWAEFRIASPVQGADLRASSTVLTLQDCAAPPGKAVPTFRALVDGVRVGSQIRSAAGQGASQWWLQVEMPESLSSDVRHRLTLEALCGDRVRTDTLSFTWRERGVLGTALGLARNFRISNRSDMSNWDAAFGAAAWGMDALRESSSSIEAAELSAWLTGYHRGWERRSEKERRIHLPGELLPGLSALGLAFDDGLAAARERLRDLIWFLKVTPVNEIGALDRWGSSPLAWSRVGGISASDLLNVSVFAAQAGIRMADRDLLDFAFRQPAIYRSKLRDSNSGLYHQVWLEGPDRPQNEGSGFSLRANGQVLMALVSLLGSRPADESQSDEVQIMARELAARLHELQLPSGGFPLGVGSRYPVREEVSATAWIATAMARGVREGVLPPRYLASVRQAWEYISSRVIDITPADPRSQPRYSLDQIAGLTRLPDRREVEVRDAPHGLGPVLLLASELSALGGF